MLVNKTHQWFSLINDIFRINTLFSDEKCQFWVIQ
jgi:hypothetical protein